MSPNFAMGGCLVVVLLMGVCFFSATPSAPRASAPPVAGSNRSTADRLNPGPQWIQLLRGMPVFSHPDSIRQTGAGTYSAVIYRPSDLTPELTTEEVNCRTLASRTLRERRGGRRPSDERTPSAPWESTPPASARAVMLAKVCEIGMARAMRR